jgi:hypothetical protein
VDGAAEQELESGIANAGKVVRLDTGHVPAVTHPELVAEVLRTRLVG